MKAITTAAVALAAACLFIGFVLTSSALAHDFSWPWQAARLLLEGRTPYGVQLFPSIPAWGDPFFYPLPAALVALPLAGLPAPLAGAVFVGLSVGLLAYHLPRHLWPILLSAPVVVSVMAGQWAPLLAAGLVYAPASALWVCKPSLGAALFLARPSRWPILGGAALCLVGLALLPSWPVEWLAVLRRSHHPIPLLTPAGLVLAPLLALLLWRRGLADWRVRLLLGLCLVPQMVRVYDQAPALTVAETRRGALVLALASWAAHLASYPLTDAAPALAPTVLFALGYGPPLLLALRSDFVHADPGRVGAGRADRAGGAHAGVHAPADLVRP